MQAREPRPCGRSNGVSPCRARRTSTEPFCVCENNPRILLNFFFREKFLTLQYFHIFEFSSSSCLFGFGRFRCALVSFNTDFGAVWFPATVCQAKIWQPQFSWHVFGFFHTLACHTLLPLWPTCHRDNVATLA